MLLLTIWFAPPRRAANSRSLMMRRVGAAVLLQTLSIEKNVKRKRHPITNRTVFVL
jgi:hypothetical protein